MFNTVYPQIYSRDFITSRPSFIHEKNSAFANVELVKLSSSAHYTLDGKPRSISNPDYTELNLYFTVHLKNTASVNISFAVTAGVAAAVNGGGRKNYGDPWFWLQYRPVLNLPLELRLACNFNRWGDDSNLWPRDNKVDLGFAVSKSLNRLNFEGIVSYRIRGNLSEMEHLNFGDYDEMGNEIHYRGSCGYLIHKKYLLVLNLTGYNGGNKSLEGTEIPDSNSMKSTIGFDYIYKKESGDFKLFFLYDMKTRYDRKGRMFGIAKSF
ncbi:MAG: hypothetical protein DWQ10_08795 [Calditrichaeota bacterium]|nr:MAG: hypothetical protein DWQ10_08795 [Calditrichota bacterium]